MLIFIHKEEMLATVAREYPARRYVLIDDKERILEAVKKQWGERLVTVFPRQGHYAHDPKNVGQVHEARRDCGADRRSAGMDIGQMVAG